MYNFDLFSVPFANWYLIQCVLGITWTQEIVWLVQNHDRMEEADKTSLFLRVPFVDLKHPDGQTYLTTLKATAHPWLIKSHLPASIFKSQIEAGKSKFIVIMRNIKDMLVSNFHFYRATKSQGFFTGPFEEFFELFRSKRLSYGDWLDHVLGWWKYRDYPNVLLIKYESMKDNPTAEIERIATFCSQSLTAEKIEYIVNRTSFSTMKNNPMSHFTMHAPKEFFDSSISPLIRKGEIGDWKNYFTDEMNLYVEKHYLSKARQEGLEFKS